MKIRNVYANPMQARRNRGAVGAGAVPDFRPVQSFSNWSISNFTSSYNAGK